MHSLIEQAMDLRRDLIRISEGKSSLNLEIKHGCLVFTSTLRDSIKETTLVLRKVGDRFKVISHDLHPLGIVGQDSMVGRILTLIS